MKTIILPLLILLVSCAPMLQVNMDSMQEVIKSDLSKDELYVKSSQWMVHTLNSEASAIQFSDKESGTIASKYLLFQTYSVNNFYRTTPGCRIYAVITIDVKDNTARITITPEDYSTAAEGGNPKLTYTEETARQDIKNLIEDYRSFITTKDKSDW